MKTYSVFEKDDVDVGGEDFISDRVMKVTFGILDFLRELSASTVFFSPVRRQLPTRKKLSLTSWLVSRGLPVTGSFFCVYCSSAKKVKMEIFIFLATYLT